MNYKIIALVVLVVLLGVGAWAIYEHTPQGLMNGTWQEKLFGQEGASLGRRITVEADIDTALLSKKGLDFSTSSLIVVGFAANGRKITPEISLVENWRVRLVFSDANWVTSFEDTKPVKGMVTFRDKNGKEIEVGGSFRRLDADRSGLAPATGIKK